MAEATEYRGKLVKETDKARLLESELGKHWIPKSIFTYFSNDGFGGVRFKVENWKEFDIEVMGFKYF